MQVDNFDFIESGKRTILLESKAVAELQQRVNETFVQACKIILNCSGKVVVTGVGKSGHIGNKIAATLASTGTPAFFVHPAEANHGDFGMIAKGDVILGISNSGASPELVSLLPMIKRMGISLISMSGRTSSPLADAADVNLDISVDVEACPHNLAPTSSTTATLAMGDALAIALLEAKGFTAEDFAFSHPGGHLGKKLLLRVEDIMHAGPSIPQVSNEAHIVDALQEISTKKLGMTTVTDDNGKLDGIFTDGDLRRCIEAKIDVHSEPLKNIMTKKPRTIKSNALAAEALNLMETHKITSLVVEDECSKVVGIIHMHDLLKAGLI